MPLQATSGAASYDAFGGGVPVVPNYIEDVFSTWLYTGNGSTQTITNGIDLSTKGGMMWLARRDSAFDPRIWDTVRGRAHSVATDLTNAQTTESAGFGLTSFNTDGFSVGPASSTAPNLNAASYVSWTFRKQPKFFDVVTFTANPASNPTTVNHNLGSVPGCIIAKRADGTGDWFVSHRAAPTSYAGTMFLNTTAAALPNDGTIESVTDTSFKIYTYGVAGAQQWVAYVFAHNAGGFGLTGTDNVISCGSYSGNGVSDGPSISLGYEAQYVLIKRTDAASNWHCQDNMRGMSQTETSLLFPNLSNAENTGSLWVSATSTGFKINTASSGFNASGGSYIYIAIRRGPMKVPTSGTSVFAPVYATASSGTSRTIGFTADLTFSSIPSFSDLRQMNDRLRGYATSGSATPPTLLTSSTAAEAGSTATVYNVWNTTVLDGNYANSFANIWYHFGRAPSFFDEVCYTGDSNAGRTLNHNLTVVPELIIVKNRSFAVSWVVYSAAIGATNYLILNNTAASTASSFIWNNTAPTSSVFTVDGFGGNNNTNFSGRDYVAYLFATCAGVSKVGSYTGNGSTQTIDCGFGAGGARFVLIKRTDDLGGWYVYDTARGMTVLTDPYLLLNDTAAESATLGSVTTVSTGFALNSSVLAAINVSGGTYIFLAIA